MLLARLHFYTSPLYRIIIMTCFLFVPLLLYTLWINLIIFSYGYSPNLYMRSEVEENLCEINDTLFFLCII